MTFKIQVTLKVVKNDLFKYNLDIYLAVLSNRKLHGLGKRILRNSQIHMKHVEMKRKRSTGEEKQSPELLEVFLKKE